MPTSGWQEAASALQSQIDTINSQISVLSGQSSANGSAISFLQSQISAIQSQILALQGNSGILIDLTGQIQPLQNPPTSGVPANFQFNLGGNAVLDVSNLSSLDDVAFNVILSGQIVLSTNEISNNDSVVLYLGLGDGSVSTILSIGSISLSTTSLIYPFIYALPMFWDSTTQRLNYNSSFSTGFGVLQRSVFVPNQSDLSLYLATRLNNGSVAPPLSIIISQFKMQKI